MKQGMILISRKEYEGMKETIEVLQNPEIMKQILESEKNISKGKLKKLEDVDRDLIKQLVSSLEDIEAGRIKRVA